MWRGDVPVTTKANAPANASSVGHCVDRLSNSVTVGVAVGSAWIRDRSRASSVIATANNRDKGVNELSAALKRRFNTVVLPVPANEASVTVINVDKAYPP